MDNRTIDNMPIFRAETTKQDFMQEIDSLKCIDGVWYVIGYYSAVGFARLGDYVHGIDGYEHAVNKRTMAIHFPYTSSTQSEKVWYNMEEISNILKEYENGRVEED